jgi:site-specific DNA recombinase
MNTTYKSGPVETAKRAVLYARVSSDDRGKDGRNLDDQIEMCRRYALEHGWQVVRELKEDDRGASGAQFDLAELNRMLEMAEAGEFDILVVREMDRLSRDLAKQLYLERLLSQAGIRIEYVLADYADNLDGKLQKEIRAVLAEYERLKITERMVRGRRLKVKAGNVLTFKRPPFGYQLDELNGKNSLEVCESEARIVRLVFSWYAEGDEAGTLMSIADITRALTKLNIPTRGDTRPEYHGRKKRGHGKWSRGTVHRMLKNETYAGVWRYGKTVGRRGERRKRTREDAQLVVEVPPIVSRGVWEAAQARLEKNRRDAARRPKKYQYLMSGRVTCGMCGLKMTGSSNGRPEGSVLLYYRCRSRPHKLDVARECNLPGFRADHVDAAVWEWLKSLLLHPEALEQGLWQAHQERERENSPLRDRLDVLNTLVTEKQAQLQRLLDLYLSGQFPMDDLIDRKARLEKTISSLEKEQKELVAHLKARSLTAEEIRSLQEFAARIGKNLAEMDDDFDAKRAIVDALDVQVTLTVEDGQRVLYARCIIAEYDCEVSHNTKGNASQSQFSDEQVG